MRITQSPRLATAGLSLAILAGLVLSLQASFAAWPFDTDMADLPLLGEGIRAHGWRFLKSWHYTQDNWLFSLAPVHWLVYAVFGARPAVIVGGGWTAFLGCVALAGWLAARLGGPATGLGIAALLLLSNAACLGAPGFFTYPITHTASLLWGLASLHGAIAWLRRGSRTLLALAMGALFVAALSDPWTQPAIGLPLTLAAGLTALLPPLRPWRRAASILCGASALACLLALTRCFHLVGFVPHVFLVTGPSTTGQNLRALVLQLGAVWNPVPGLPAPGLETAVAIVVGVAALIALATAQLLRRLWQGVEAGASLAVLTMAGSCAATLAAVLLAHLPSTDAVGRFFVAGFVFVPLLVWFGLRRTRLRGMLLGLAALLVLAGLVNRPAAWWRQPIAPRTDAVMARVAFLRDQHLSHGYGAYWGSAANAVTMASRGTVRLRAVTFDPATGRIAPGRRQTSPWWYGPEDAAGAGDTFLWIADDGDDCRDVRRCIDGAIAQFGPPDRRLAWRDATILVWNRGFALNPPGITKQ